MTDKSSTDIPAPTARDRKKDEARARMLDAVFALMAEGKTVSHDAVAERAGVGRRTAYRYFPDRDALMEAAWQEVRVKAGLKVVLPDTTEDILASLEPVYTGFDSIGDLVTVVRASQEGRALRIAGNAARLKTYRTAMAEAVKDLPKSDRDLAAAVVQLLHTTVWPEMHDHWGFDGKQMARATGWAIRALLADLKARGSRPLDEPL